MLHTSLDVLGWPLECLPVSCARLAAPDTGSVPSCCGLTLQKRSGLEPSAGWPAPCEARSLFSHFGLLVAGSSALSKVAADRRFPE